MSTVTLEYCHFTFRKVNHLQDTKNLKQELVTANRYSVYMYVVLHVAECKRYVHACMCVCACVGMGVCVCVCVCMCSPCSLGLQWFNVAIKDLSEVWPVCWTLGPALEHELIQLLRAALWVWQSIALHHLGLHLHVEYAHVNMYGTIKCICGTFNAELITATVK